LIGLTGLISSSGRAAAASAVCWCRWRAERC
jgi:hypothetical protein